MFPVSKPTLELPIGMLPFEDEDFFLVRCAACGAELVYHCGRVDPHRVEADALLHFVECQTARAEDR